MLKYIFPLFLTIFILSGSFQVTAQILPPTPVCVRADTIFWEIPTNPCGPFDNYVLFGGNAENGTYQVVDTIFDINQDLYFHQNANGQTWYYYMQANADCLGETPLNSDTINNTIPEIVSTDFVTVLNNQVEIHWSPSSSLQVIGYVVNRVTNLGTTAIDTVSSTSYIDLEANSESNTEIYYILGIDACGNTSIFDVPHFTTYLSSVTDACERTIDLNWNPYQNWAEGIDTQELWLSVNGNAAQLVANLDAETNNYLYENANDGDSYCFYIEAIENNTDFRSRSNELCQIVDVIQPNKDLVFTNMNITADQSIELNWYWNNDAALERYQITGEASSVEISYEEFPITTPLNTVNSYLDLVTATDAAYTYTISTTDDCGDIVETSVNHLFIQGDLLPNRDNCLFWTALDIPNAVGVSYEVYKINDSNIKLIATINGDPIKVTDTFDPAEIKNGNTCYYVEALANVILPDGSSTTIRSRSNTTCISQLASIQSPNAFTPNGKNPIFKPAVAFKEEILSYKMLIFDRWGALLFESNAVNDGWNGRDKNGKEMPQGAYTFMIQLQQASGAYLEDKGVLVLLR